MEFVREEILSTDVILSKWYLRPSMNSPRTFDRACQFYASSTGDWIINDLIICACKRGNAAYVAAQLFQVEHEGSQEWNSERGALERPKHVTVLFFGTVAQLLAVHDRTCAAPPHRAARPGGHASNTYPHSGNQLGCTEQRSFSLRSLHAIGGQTRWRPGLASALSISTGTVATLGARQPGGAAAHSRIQAGPDTHGGLCWEPSSTAGWTDPPIRGHGTSTSWLGGTADVHCVYAGEW